MWEKEKKKKVRGEEGDISSYTFFLAWAAFQSALARNMLFLQDFPVYVYGQFCTRATLKSAKCLLLLGAMC